MNRRTAVAALAMAAVIAAAIVPAASAPSFDRGTLRMFQDTRRLAILTVEIARTDVARSQGLMNRRSLPEDAGMLFVFEDDGKWGFWMKNTVIPLSIGFIDRQWRLLEIQDMEVAPDPAHGPFKIYEPKSAYRYALEVNQGYFTRKGITPGARFELVTAK